MMPEEEYTHHLNLRSLLERVRDHLRNPWEPDNQSRLYKDVVAALPQAKTIERTLAEYRKSLTLCEAMCREQSDENAKLRRDNERLLKTWMKTFEGKQFPLGAEGEAT